MKRCRHKNTRDLIWRELSAEQHATGVYHIRIGTWHWRVALTSPPEAIVCVDCRAWFPLGPSNDADARVAIEIMAAELASWSNVADEPMLAWAGRRHFIEGHEMPTGATALAGWLAQEITTHTEQREASDE